MLESLAGELAARDVPRRPCQRAPRPWV